MNKIAIFVEGQTEQIFIARLLREIAGENNLAIKRLKARGGKKTTRSIEGLEAAAATAGRNYYALIVDCSGDSRVASDVNEQYESLVGAGYQAIIGIRGVRPQKSEDAPKIRKYFCPRLMTRRIKPLLVLAIMETEAWFIAEYSHLVRIDAKLTPDYVNRNLGFDPSIQDMRQRPAPSDDLNEIYKLAGYYYNKSKSIVERTVEDLDYAKIYLELPEKFNDLRNLAKSLDDFFAAAP